MKGNVIEVAKPLKKMIEVAEGAINDKHLMKFIFASKDQDPKERTIRPYMIIPRNGNLELVGVPTTELSKPENKRQPRHYTISQLAERLKSNQVEVLPETFNDPGIPRDIVVLTKEIPVCRFIYDDENAEEVKAEWLRIKYV